MAEFWARISDESISEKFESVDALLKEYRGARTFYVQGDGIDFQDFFALDIVGIAECIVSNTDVNQCYLASNPELPVIKNNIVFENCKIKDFRLAQLSVYSLSFINCKLIILKFKRMVRLNL